MNIPADFVPIVLFKHNPNNVPVSIVYPTLSCSKELFFFLLDILCKGLVYLYGKSDVSERTCSTYLDDLTKDQILEIALKLQCAGISLNVDFSEPVIQEGADANASSNMQAILAMDDNLPIDKYKLTLNSKESTYTLSFSLDRVL